jgi:hypothetical protein
MVDESLNPSPYKNQAYLPAWFFHRVAENHCRVLATDERQRYIRVHTDL